MTGCSSWSWDEINAEWLLGNKLALRPEAIVEAFKRAEKVLGRAWIEAARVQSGRLIQGTWPTLHVVTVGELLASLEGASNADELIEKLRGGDRSAFAELEAVHAVRSKEPSAIIEFGPEAQVADRNRKPDFRTRRGSEEWTYVEVTQPDIAEAHERVQGILNRLADLVVPIKKSFALEIFLRREPTDSEVDSIADLVPEFCESEADQSRDLARLAILSLNTSPPGQVVPVDHPGEPNVPRLGCAKAVWGSDEPHRHVSVRMAYADDRAEEFLRREARQLPNDAPGLIMVQMSRAPGGISTWAAVLKRRLQPKIHTRVSGVCLFDSGYELTQDGEAWVAKSKLILNPHARISLPVWIADALSQAAAVGRDE